MFGQLGGTVSTEVHASAFYQSVRDGMLDGVNPNSGTIGWAEFLDRIAWADQAAREIVAHELIYVPSNDDE